MKTRLVDIPCLDFAGTRVWQVKALVIDGKSPALEALSQWAVEELRDYKKIKKAIEIASQVTRTKDEKKVKKSQNPAHGQVYEFRADKGHARLMFFYDKIDGNMIICTNPYWKNRGNQDKAFALCSKLKDLYEKERGR